jgi:hypothetical protein
MKRIRNLAISFLLGLLLVTPAAAIELAAIQADLHGFLDARYGQRLQSDRYEDEQSLGEVRLQLELSRMGDRATLQLKTDIYYDNVVDQNGVDLEDGSGWLDLREANLTFSPHDQADVKFGRQILTWGTGDLLFINDLFPKDWQAFFSGRDVDYLKAPSDAIFISFFPEWANIDLVYTPRFDADRFISGERISYWNPALNRLAGEDAVIKVNRPDDWFSDDEWSLRISRNFDGYELELYGYDGYWKSPAGFDPTSGKATFPRLRVLGASLRGNLGKGIASLETGYYDSFDDSNGKDPLVPNSEWRGLAGYEQEVVRNVTAGFQYYVEAMQNHDRYRDSLTSTATARDAFRQVVTTRLTWQLLNQNLALSAFCYWSPSDQDGYLRPALKYKITDAWQVSAGANLFWGKDDHTFFGQFTNNNNLYTGLRYSF